MAMDVLPFLCRKIIRIPPIRIPACWTCRQNNIGSTSNVLFRSPIVIDLVSFYFSPLILVDLGIIHGTPHVLMLVQFHCICYEF